MKSYVWLTFGFMGWAYYEMSGGSDFVPVEIETASAEADQVQTPELVTRASTPTLLSVSTSNIVEPTEINDAVAAAVALDDAQAAPDVIEVTAPITQPDADIREVAGNRVNMRVGPGTGFDVITTLSAGTKLEVLAVNDEGWANVATVDRGIEGWMAERLLTDTDI